MYTATIVDASIFRSLGKPPNAHFDTLERAVKRAETEI